MVSHVVRDRITLRVRVRVRVCVHVRVRVRVAVADRLSKFVETDHSRAWIGVSVGVEGVDRIRVKY